MYCDLTKRWVFAIQTVVR